jgi:hypothetical protein
MLVRPKIRLEFVANFFAAKITRLLHHVYHADHHVLTIKKPPPETRISQNTPQKHQQNASKPGSAPRPKKISV